MQDYLAQNGMTSVRQMIGKALPNIVPAESVNRRTIEYPKFNRRICVGCGRCYISCFDGGHQALRMDENDNRLWMPKSVWDVSYVNWFVRQARSQQEPG